MPRKRNPDVPPAFERDLEEHNCLNDFESLVGKAGCSANWLMFAVGSLRLAFQHHERLKGNPRAKEGRDEPDEFDLAEKAARMDKGTIRALVDKTRWVARKWEQQFQTPFGKEIVRWAGREASADEEGLLTIPQRLFSLASWAADIHRKTKHRQRPLYDDCLARLVEYVKRTTGSYHDNEVSALVSFAIERDSYDQTTLRVWKSEHPQALHRARLYLDQNH